VTKDPSVVSTKNWWGANSLGTNYQGDLEIEEFLSHGGRPSDKGAFDWQRLTGPEYEYKSLRRGIDFS